jgi:heavy metal sensor kinase
MWIELAVSLAKGRDKTLGNRASRLVALLERSSRDSEEWKGSQFDNFAQATPEGRLIQVFDSGMRRLYPRGSNAAPFPWPKAMQHGSEYQGQAQFQGRVFRVLGRTVIIDGSVFHLFLAGQLEDNRATLARFTEGLLWAVPLVFVVSGLAGYFVSRRALNPVNRLIASVRSISIGNLSRRLPVTDNGDELARLATTCNEMLERLEKAVGQINRFTADASHELRSPLAFIRTVAECALATPNLDQESEEAFTDIVMETKQASKLLEDMLVLARADAGHTDAAFENVNLAPLVSEVAVKNEPLVAERSQHLALRIDVPDAYVMGDSTRLRRLLWILTDNAIKYTPDGGQIELSLRPWKDGVAVAIRDNGIGIPQSALPHIFERFYRVDAARSQQTGTGLGLAIAKWIADVHQATLEVESEEEKGSIFRITFPLQTPVANDP